MSTTQQPRAYRQAGKIIIEMPEDNLIFAAENSPHYDAKVTDREAYLNELTRNLLEYTSGTDDDPMLFCLFDDITLDMLESAADGIKAVDRDNE